MNSEVPGISEFDLHALVDGQLQAQRREAVEAYLETDPEAASRVEEWRLQKRELKALFDPIMSEPVPPGLLAPPVRHPRQLPGWLRHAAMAVLYVSAGAAGTHLVSGPGPAATAPGPAQASTLTFVDQAALAHAVYTPEVLHPVEVRADQQAHLVKWLSKRLQHPLKAPDLGERGLHLVGGRLLPGEKGPAAQFMYENEQGQRLTLFVRSDLEKSHDSAFRFSHRDGVSVFYWIDDHLGYALSGTMEREPLLDLATLIYAQINQ